MLSIPHMLVVFVIVLVVFGPQKLPELARSLGKLMAEFRKASSDFRGAFEEEMKDLERQARDVERKKAAEAAAASAAAAPVQPATLATVADTETATPAGEVTAPADTRATEGMVVTPVAEAVARTATDGAVIAGSNGAETSPGANPEAVNTDPVSSTEVSTQRIATDVPHDQQPA